MRIVDFCYNGKDGIAETIIENCGKRYFGVARCHPEDAKYKSEQIGKDLSYMRAVAEGQKAELQEMKKELEVAENFVKSLECYKTFNKLDTDPSAKCVYRQLNRRRREVASAAYELKISNWIIRQISYTGSKLDDVLLKLDAAIDRGDI